jgi:hypothetical protein
MKVMQWCPDSFSHPDGVNQGTSRLRPGRPYVRVNFHFVGKFVFAGAMDGVSSLLCSLLFYLPRLLRRLRLRVDNSWFTGVRVVNIDLDNPVSLFCGRRGLTRMPAEGVNCPVFERVMH